MAATANGVSTRSLVDTKLKPLSVGRRREWPEALKRQMVSEALERGSSVSIVARRHDVKTNQLLKLLWWDGDGLCLFAKRLERGRFVWPRAEQGVAVLTAAQLSMLLEGIDWRRPVRTAQPELAG